jgi:hypothetical protein
MHTSKGMHVTHVRDDGLSGACFSGSPFSLTLATVFCGAVEYDHRGARRELLAEVLMQVGRMVRPY